MANFATKAVKKTAKKATKKAVRGGVNYAKGAIAKGLVCWLMSGGIAMLPKFGIQLPTFLTGYDTVAMVGFIIVGFFFFGRKLTVGRLISLGTTFLK